MNRISVLIDGFNFYHSIKDIERDTGLKVKWLNIASLSQSFTHLVTPPSRIESIHFFTAYATHLNDPDIVARHRNYVKCLEDSGIKIELGRFKQKSVSCPNCHVNFIRHEEKETDVRIATAICHLFSLDLCDSIVLVTGDTDLAAGVEHSHQCYPGKNIVFAFPYKRANAELSTLAPGSFKIRKNSYVGNQLQNPCVLRDGTHIYKPANW